jgi:hypothetical protein
MGSVIRFSSSTNASSSENHITYSSLLKSGLKTHPFKLYPSFQNMLKMHSWVPNMPARMLSPRSSTESIRSSSSGISEPDKLIPAVAGPMVWEGMELDPRDYVVELLKSEIENIRAAVVSFKCGFLQT